MVAFLTQTTVCGFSLYQTLAYFLIYSCLGWCLEVVYAAVTTGKLVNRGFLNGPVCPIYGFGMIIVLYALTPLVDNTLLLYLGGVILPSVLELVGGWALYKLYRTRWWDYSDYPFNIGGYICLEFCLLWGVGYNTDGFREKSGLTTAPVTADQLAQVTAYFADQLALSAGEVPRDGDGVCRLDYLQLLTGSENALDVLTEEFPFLDAKTGRAKAFGCSRALSALRFTGFYFPFTGEANVNTDSPSAFLPATVCHEMAHQRGITAEEECNFIGILAATRSDSAAYRYSGWLTGFGYLSNALYSADRDAWQIIRDSLPETVVADLRADNAYWSQFRGTVSQLSDKVYDGFLKSNGDADGAKSYGVVTDLLVAYFGA